MSSSISNITDGALDAELPPLEAAALVRRAVERHGEGLVLALSLSVEDTLLLDLLAEAAGALGARPRVVTLDTGRLPEESYTLIEQLRERYPLPIEVYFPAAAAVEALYRQRGPLSFYRSIEDREACCAVRKIEPLGRALAGASAWMVGLRRAHGPTRVAIERVERDAAHGGIVKLSPLAHFSDDELWSLARQREVLVHALHGRGYPSIGCAPCTRAIAPGEPMRAGRWWWEDPAHKECGIHGKGQR